MKTFLSKKSLVVSVITLTLVSATMINAPTAHASTLSFLRSIFQEKMTDGKANATENRDKRNAMLVAETGTINDTSATTSVSLTTTSIATPIATSTDPIHILAVSLTNLTRIESWILATTTAAEANGADVSSIQPILDDASDELAIASTSIDILVSSSTAGTVSGTVTGTVTGTTTQTVAETATASLDSARGDFVQALEVLKTIVNN